MAVSLDDVAQISRAVVAEAGFDVSLVTVASSSADAHRVELLVTLGRSPQERRQFLLNLSRQGAAIFEQSYGRRSRNSWSPSRPVERLCFCRLGISASAA